MFALKRKTDLFRVTCVRDVEGTVGKWAHGRYHADGHRTSWLKIKNPAYTQIIGRHQLFARRSVEGVRRRRAVTPHLDLTRIVNAAVVAARRPRN